jgi:protein-S-isoprenylcysteine O-methyltransferase Ste14
MLVGLPVVPYYLWVCLTYNGGALAGPASITDVPRLLRHVPIPTWTSALLYGAWLLLQIVLQLAAPGRIRYGTPLANGSRLPYHLNGWFAFWCTWAVLVIAVWRGWISPTIGYDQFGPLLTVANIVAFLLAAFLYARGKRSPDHVTTGDALHDYVMGVSLNPRIRGFDLKYFCESRPGLILWVAINASLAATQYRLHGRVTTPMILVNAFQFLYVADYFFHEEAIVTTWDIKHERFGWMLCWGCLVWVPFIYTIQAYYLVTHTHDLSAIATIGIVVLNMAGYVIFRSANIQKHRFRMDPNRPVWGRPPAYIQTTNGALLLTSGWWGVARHLNYFGDLLMGLAWCLPAGFEHPLPYFYIVYFLILLIHRERRDHRMCLAKYGQDWEAYCQRVRWRIVPGLY